MQPPAGSTPSAPKPKAQSPPQPWDPPLEKTPPTKALEGRGGGWSGWAAMALGEQGMTPGGRVSSVGFAAQTSQLPCFSIFMSLKPNMQIYAEVKPGLSYF